MNRDANFKPLHFLRRPFFSFSVEEVMHRIARSIIRYCRANSYVVVQIIHQTTEHNRHGLLNRGAQVSFDNYQAFGGGYRPATYQHETFIGVPGASQHGHVVWHDGPNGPVYDHVRDAQGNVYVDRPSAMYRFLGDIATNGR